MPCAIGLCAILMLAALGCGGGSRSVSIPVWQKNVEQYVRNQGKGDPTVLRDVTLPDARRGYSVLGSDRPADSTDANGVLLGLAQHDGRRWFVYLVGLVKQLKVNEIRIAALSTDGGRYEWKLGENDREALSKYRGFHERMWKQRFPQRQSMPADYLNFPRPEDNFALSTSAGTVTVTHPPSGAAWELKLPQSRPARAAR
jgi:hypothetical protein